MHTTCSCQFELCAPHAHKLLVGFTNGGQYAAGSIVALKATTRHEVRVTRACRVLLARCGCRAVNEFVAATHRNGKQCKCASLMACSMPKRVDTTWFFQRQPLSSRVSRVVALGVTCTSGCKRASGTRAAGPGGARWRAPQISALERRDGRSPSEEPNSTVTRNVAASANCKALRRRSGTAILAVRVIAFVCRYNQASSWPE